MARKILYSPGYGAGWSTWNRGEVARYMLTYQPIIDALEAGQDLTQPVQQLVEDCELLFGEKYVCTLGARDLRIYETHSRVRITEYDGYESVEEEGEYDGWM